MTKVRISNGRGDPVESETSIWENMSERLEAVRRRAFELFRLRGSQPGNELADWLAAEREILQGPEAELRDAKDLYEVEVKLPGFASDDIEVAATSDEVVVHAAAEREMERSDDYATWTEYGSRDVFRRFALPEAIDAEKVTADFEDGVLRVRARKVTHTASQPTA